MGAKGKVKFRNGRVARSYASNQIGAQWPERFPVVGFGGEEGLADEREGFAGKGIVVKMVKDGEDDPICEKIEGAGK